MRHAVHDFDLQVRQCRQQLAVVRAYGVIANAMVVPRLVVIAPRSAKRLQDSIQVVRVFAADMLFDEIRIYRTAS